MCQITWAFHKAKRLSEKKRVKVKASAAKIKAAVQAWSEGKSLCLRKGNSILTAGECRVPTRDPP